MYVEMDAERVQELREEKGLSKRALAAAAGISEKTAGNVEREVQVSLTTARKIGAALDVDDPGAWAG